MQPETRMLYKLMILYFLDKVDFPITNSKLTGFLLEKEYISYMNIHEICQDLIEDGYIRSDMINNSHVYSITKGGHEALSFFSGTLSPVIKDEIDVYLQKNEYALKGEVSSIADYYKIRQDEFAVRLQVLERGLSIFDLSLSITSEESAEFICHNWKSKSSDIYAYVLSSLMSVESM